MPENNQTDKPEFLSAFSKTDDVAKSLSNPSNEPLNNLIKNADKFNSNLRQANPSTNPERPVFSTTDKIKSILKQHGMDSQQQEKALAQILDVINNSVGE